MQYISTTVITKIIIMQYIYVVSVSENVIVQYISVTESKYSRWDFVNIAVDLSS